jgi:hypothetical protein
MSYTIGITTFSKRYELVVKLVRQIRSFTDETIIITINGEKDGEFDDEYRRKILELCSSLPNIYPTFFIETRGLSKMWNTVLIMSNDEHVLMLNDDIEIVSPEIFNVVKSHINTNSFTGLSKINSSFSHFIVSKEMIDSVGYFDERLLGFGEEDGDITYRLLKHGININNIRIPNVVNIVSNIRHEHVKSGIGKYSHFNRDFIYNRKYVSSSSSKLKGMFDTPMDQQLPDINQYPTEKFFKDNKSNL